MPLRRAAVLLVPVLLLAACGDADDDPTAVVPPSPEVTGEPTPAPPSPTSPDDTVTGEAPADLLREILGDAEARTGVPTSEIVVVRDEQVEWNDGSLGCPQPGQAYTQAIVPGYWVVLDAAGTTLDYRTDDRGFFVLCEDGAAPTAPAPDS